MEKSQEEIATKNWEDKLIIDKSDTLINSYTRWIGEIKTPFNKHDLLARLGAFLKKDTTFNSIYELLDSSDRIIIALLLYADINPFIGISFSQLKTLTTDILKTDSAFIQKINNLTERMIIYSYQYVSSIHMIAITPAFAEKFKLFIRPYEVVLKADEEQIEKSNDIISDMCTVLSCAIHSKQQIRATATSLGQKIKKEIEDANPGLTEDKERLQRIIDVFLKSGVFGLKDNSIYINPTKFYQICRVGKNLTPILFASSYFNLDETIEARKIIPIVVSILSSVPHNMMMTDCDFMRIGRITISSFAHIEDIKTKEFDSFQKYESIENITSECLSVLEKTGIVIRNENHIHLASFTDNFFDDEKNISPEIIIEDSHEIKIMPEANNSTKAFISIIAQLEHTGLVWTANVNRATLRAANAYGLKCSEIKNTLQKLSGLPLPQSMNFLIDEVENQNKAIKLRSGFVIVMEQYQADILEHSPKANDIILEKLSQGVFIINAKTAKAATALLQEAGIDIDYREKPEPQENEDLLKAMWNGTFDVKNNENTEFTTHNIIENLKEQSQGDPILVEKLIDKLSTYSIPDSMRFAIKNMIYSRQILSDEQLEKIINTDFVDSKISKAGAMDYQGKIRLIDSAIKDSENVEILYSTKDKENRKVYGKPVKSPSIRNDFNVSLLLQDGSLETIPMSSIITVILVHHKSFGI